MPLIQQQHDASWALILWWSATRCDGEVQAISQVKAESHRCFLTPILCESSWIQESEILPTTWLCLRGSHAAFIVGLMFCFCQDRRCKDNDGHLFERQPVILPATGRPWKPHRVCLRCLLAGNFACLLGVYFVVMPARAVATWMQQEVQLLKRGYFRLLRVRLLSSFLVWFFLSSCQAYHSQCYTEFCFWADWPEYDSKHQTRCCCNVKQTISGLFLSRRIPQPQRSQTAKRLLCFCEQVCRSHWEPQSEESPDEAHFSAKVDSQKWIEQQSHETKTVQVPYLVQ